jgi:WD40 repeat protein
MEAIKLKNKSWISGAMLAVVAGLTFTSVTILRTLGADSRPVNHINTGQRVDAAAFSTTQQLLALSRMVGNASDRLPYEINLWSAKDKRVVWSRRTDSALTLAFSPDSETLASGTHKGIALWQVKDGLLLRTLDSSEPEESGIANKQVLQVSFSRDGRTLAAAGLFRLWVWKMPDGILQKTIDLPECGMPKSLSFSSDGRTLAVGCGEFNRAETPDPSYYPILLWNLASGNLVRKLEGHVTEVSSLDFSPGGDVVASGGGGSDGELRLWRVSDGSLLGARKVDRGIRERIRGYSPSISVAFSPDGQTVAYGGADNKIHLLRVANRKVLRTFDGDASAILKIAFSSDGGTLSSITAKGSIQSWNVASAH